MKAVRLVFASRANLRTWLFGHTSGLGALAALCLLAATGGLVAGAWQTWETRQHIRSVQKALLSLRAHRGEVARQVTPDERSALTVQQTRDWNQLARHLNTPWPTILDALETATPASVALVAIEPDPQRGSVRLQAEAKALDTLLDYAEALKAAGPFQEVVLVKHETNEQDATRPMRLSLDARLQWRQPDRRRSPGGAS
jgi:hypothetical protein